MGCDSAITAENPQTVFFSTFTTGTLSSFSLSSSSTVVGNTGSTLTVKFNPGTIMKPQGKIEFLVPRWYSSTTQNFVLSGTSAVSSSGITTSGSGFS